MGFGRSARAIVFGSIATLALGGQMTCISSAGTVPAKAIGIEREWRGSSSGYTESTQLVVRPEARWADVWAKLHQRRLPRPELPPIDFELEMALAVCMGERPSGGYAIQILDVLRAEETIVVQVEETEPSPESLQTMALTQPYHVVVVKRSPLPVRFQRRTARRWTPERLDTRGFATLSYYAEKAAAASNPDRRCWKRPSKRRQSSGWVMM